MIFEIVAQHVLTGGRQTFSYDNERNALTAPGGKPIAFLDADDPREKGAPSSAFSSTEPLRKSADVRVLKVQMGLSCNYSCDYCSQRFVERPPATSKKDIEAFMRKLDSFNFDEQRGLKIEFWGGEPLVYIKTMRPLVEAFNARFADWERKPRYSMITNGSLLNIETNQFLIENDFAIAISHDGPGQHVRGPDPFDDEDTRAAVLDLYAALKPTNRISFNSMLHASNTSRAAIHDWFKAFTGDENVRLGEGSLVDAYDEGGNANALNTKAQHFAFRKQAFNEIYSTGGNIGFANVIDKIGGFSRAVLSHAEAEYMGQKCGMDSDDTIAVDMMGNVISCQNVSAVETAMNGESHCGGNITDLAAVEIKSATHWRNRPDCESCPVLHLCKGSCMFLEGDYWETSCANSYSDNIALFALAFEKLTMGYVPIEIIGDGLPLDRSDIWGDIHQHTERAARRVIPIVAAKGDDGMYVRATTQSV